MPLGVLAGLAAGALWALVFVAPRMATGLGAVELASGRFLVYGAFSFALMAWPLLRGRPVAWPTWPQARAALGLSVLGFTGYYLLLVLAIRDAGTELPSLIIGTIPLWMMLLGKPVGLRWSGLLPGLVLTACGLAVMAFATHSGPVQTGVFWRGVALAFASMACWTAFGLLNSAWLKKHPKVSATTWANWLGVASGFGAAILLLWSAGLELNMPSASGYRRFAAMVVVATGIGSAWLATILWNIASQRLSASLCGQLIVSETVFALLLSFAWDAQWPSALQALAMALFVAGILASIRAHR